MTFQEWLETAGGEQAKEQLSRCTDDSKAIWLLILKQAYVVGCLDGLRKGEEIYSGK